MATSQQKLEAIYDLREAAELKAHAERDLAMAPSVAARDALLEAQLVLEERTQIAVEVCHECGHAHELGGPHSSPGNVIDL